MGMISSIYGKGGKKKKKKQFSMFKKPPKYVACMKGEFYSTREWRELRWQVLLESDKRCVMCGRGRKEKVVFHVDHIKPRSKFPHLELVKSNLQVLCADCNMGKGSSYAAA